MIIEAVINNKPPSLLPDLEVLSENKSTSANLSKPN